MKLSACIVVAAVTSSAMGQISFTGINDSYSNNWDSLSTTLNAAWINDVGYPGWYLLTHTGAAISTINANAGGINGGNATGSFYSYGSTASTDRALGGLGSGGTYFSSPSNGAIAGYIAFSVTNNTASVLGSATVSFDGEQWRRGADSLSQAMIFEYGFGATFSTVSVWTAPGGNFDWSSPQFSGTGAAIDGNAAGLVAGRGGVLSSLNWQIGDTLWVRWIERNDIGNDHGLAIDNFTLTVPSPGSVALLSAALLMTTRRRR